MTVNVKDLPIYNLKINEIEQNTPPNSLELEKGKLGRPAHKASKLANKLKAYNVETVYDLVKYSEEQLSRLRIISATDLLRINQALKKTGLTLGTDVRWVEASQEYYIKKE